MFVADWHYLYLSHKERFFLLFTISHKIQGQHANNGIPQGIKVMQISHLSQVWTMERDDQFLAACKQAGLWLADCCNTDLSLVAGRLRPVSQAASRGCRCESQTRWALEGGNHQQVTLTFHIHIDFKYTLLIDCHHHRSHVMIWTSLLSCPQIDLELKDENGRSALHVACWYNKVRQKPNTDALRESGAKHL